MSRWQRLSQLTESASWCLQQLRGPKSSTTKLPVELLQDIDGLGSAGSVLKVNHGYARNFLVPRKMAAVRRGKQSGSVAGVEDSEGGRSSASAASAAGSEEEHARLLAEQQRRRLESVVRKLTTQTLTMRRKASETGELEKPIAAADVADALARQMQIEIVAEMVDLGTETLRATGDYELPLKLVLPGGERAKLDVSVVST